MPVVVHTEFLNAPPQKIWAVITDLHAWSWRSDLASIEILDEKRFVETDTSGYKTTFTITGFVPCTRYEFTMDNPNMQGRWTGVLEPDGAGTRAVFTEDVTPKKWYMKPFAKMYLKKQQATYFADLKKAVE